MTEAPATHWLLLEQPVAARALEALIVSRTLGAARIDTRTLGWQPGVILQGPMTSEELAAGGDLPRWVDEVYALTCPRERGAAIPPELRLPGGVLSAFIDGEPVGEERDALETLEALARRLGGAVLTDTGLVVVPEPRVDLLLYSNSWIEPDDLTRFLSSLGQFEEMAAPRDDRSGYSLINHNGVVTTVTATDADVIPLGFSGYGWSADAVYVYEFRHFPAETFEFSVRIPRSPAEAREMVDSGASAWIENLAATTLRAAGGITCGYICDDDGFLVSLES